jgi:hypothetical protein
MYANPFACGLSGTGLGSGGRGDGVCRPFSSTALGGAPRCFPLRGFVNADEDLPAGDLRGRFDEVDVDARERGALPDLIVFRATSKHRSVCPIASGGGAYRGGAASFR